MTVYTQGAEPYSLEDTVLLLREEVLDDDLSSEGDDLTLVSGGSYETASAKRAITGATGREIYVQTTIDPTDAGAVLLWHGDPAGYSSNTYLIELTSGVLSFKQGSTTLFDSPTLAEEGYHIHWSTRPNPDTTGASDAVISEFMVVEANDYEIVCIEQVVHAVSTTNAAWALAVGGWWDGANLKGEPTYPVQAVRIGVAHHPNAEWYDEWVDQRPAHGSTLPVPPVLLPLTLASGVGDRGWWAGAQNVGWSAAQSNAMRSRMLSNLVNENYRDAATISNAFAPTQWWASAPDGTPQSLDVTKLRWCVVPRGVTHVFCRVHMQSWVTSGDPVPIQLRVFSFNRPFRGVGNVLGGAPTPPLAVQSVANTLTVDHGTSGVGQWVRFPLLPVQVYNGASSQWRDTTLLCLGVAFDPSSVSTNDANARVKIKAWHVRPVVGIE